MTAYFTVVVGSTLQTNFELATQSPTAGVDYIRISRHRLWVALIQYVGEAPRFKSLTNLVKTAQSVERVQHFTV